MKKTLMPVFLASGLLAAVLLVLFIAGIVNFDNNHIEALINGNQQYVVKKYDKALEAYKFGLAKKPDDEKLNQNSGLAAYQLNNYEEALNYYSKTDENVERYLKAGNSCLKLGDTMNEQAGKLKFYQQAAETYKQGIVKFPENVDLKYNYEYVQEKINELQDRNDQNQDNQNQQENNDDNKENQNKDSQNKDNENKDNRNEDNQNEDNERKSNENKDNENKDNQEGNGQDNEQDSKDQDSKDDKGNEAQGDKSDGANEEEKKDGGSDSSTGMNEQNSGEDKEAIEQAQRVLEMLEQQEEESLKNNQEVKDSGKGGEHDW